MNIGIFISPFEIARCMNDLPDDAPKYHKMGYDPTDFGENQACVIAPRPDLYHAKGETLSLIRDIAGVHPFVPKVLVVFVTPSFSEIIGPIVSGFPRSIITWLYPIESMKEMLELIRKDSGTDRNAMSSYESDGETDLGKVIEDFKRSQPTTASGPQLITGEYRALSHR